HARLSVHPELRGDDRLPQPARGFRPADPLGIGLHVGELERVRGAQLGPELAPSRRPGQLVEPLAGPDREVVAARGADPQVPPPPGARAAAGPRRPPSPNAGAPPDSGSAPAPPDPRAPRRRTGRPAPTARAPSAAHRPTSRPSPRGRARTARARPRDRPIPPS